MANHPNKDHLTYKDYVANELAHFEDWKQVMLARTRDAKLPRAKWSNYGNVAHVNFISDSKLENEIRLRNFKKLCNSGIETETN